MKIGLVGYQGGGKSALFQLLTGTQPDPAKVHAGQVGVMTVPDERFVRLVEMFKPRKEVPVKIELFDTPGLARGEQSGNAQRLGVIRESAALVQVIGVFSGGDPQAEIQEFADDCVLADLQIVSNRVEKLKKDSLKPRPDREQLKAELDALLPIETALSEGTPIREVTLTDAQDKASRAFSLLSRKNVSVVLNTAESQYDPAVLRDLQAQGHRVLAAPVGLELEIGALPEEERAVFAEEMGLTESCKTQVGRAIFQITDQITFYTCDEKEVHAWLLNRGESALEAAGTIHTDLARGFIRAEIMSVDDLLRLGSEKEVRAAGLYRVEGREYVMRDGDEIVVRANV